MAFSSLRTRRALGLTSSLLKTHRSISALTSSSSSILQSSIFTPSSSTSTNVPINPKNVQSHLFHSSIPSLSSRSYNNNNYNDKIGPDEILFEGCDYMHWLITMDFPKDPAPTAEEMVETYVQTLAKVVGSVEEAKKRMYACSTTTYHGFQAVMTEEMSEKFRGLPGVVFILPDSYIDQKNKEYGGDKYINGEIIHRPPPAYYGREGGRYNQNERPRDRPYDRQSPMQDGRNQPNDRQGFTPRDQQFDRQAPMQGGGRNIGPQQGYPLRPNYEQGGRQQPKFGQLMAGQQPNVEQPMAGHQPNIRPPMAGHQQNYVSPAGQQPNYVPPAGQQPNYGQPTGQPNYGQPAWQQPNYGQAAAQPNFVGGVREQSNYGQAGQQSNFGQMAGQQPNYGHAPVAGERVDAGFAPPDDRGNYAPQQRREYAPVEHRGFGGDDTNFSPSRGGYGQGEASGFGQGYSGSGAGRTFSATQSNNMQEEQRGYTGQQGMNGYEAVKEKLSDIAAMRKAKAEAKAEEQEEKDLAKARIEVAKEMRKAKEAEAQVQHHLAKAGQKAEKELAKPHPYHQNLDNPSPNPVPNTMDGHQMHHTDRGSGSPPMEGLAEPRLTREFPPATNQHI